MYGDNPSVLISTTMPSSTVKKRHNALSYHRVREAVAAGIISFRFIRCALNWADILTKPLAPGPFYLLQKQVLMKWKVQEELKEKRGKQGNSEIFAVGFKLGCYVMQVQRSIVRGVSEQAGLKKNCTSTPGTWFLWD